MAELRHPMPKKRPRRATAPLEPPPPQLRYVDGVWRPNAPGFADRPGEPDTGSHRTQPSDVTEDESGR